jgi:hypothetical protein
MSRRIIIGIVTAAAMGLLPAVASSATVGSDRSETLTGTPGDDAIYGRSGNDLLSGLAGNDDLDGGPGADDLRGGPGDDAVSYSSAGGGVVVTLDGRANDGRPGEGDNAREDVESIYGSPAGDTLTGSASVNTIDAGVGDDRLNGGRGADFLSGGSGNDVLEAEDGAADILDCGPGADSFKADRNDVLISCERRVRVTPAARAVATVTWDFASETSSSRVVQLRVDELRPAGARIELSCRGGGCPFRSRSFTRAVNLTRFFTRALRLGARVEIRITRPDSLGKYRGFTVRRNDVRVRRACLSPGRRSPTRCPRGVTP